MEDHEKAYLDRKKEREEKSRLAFEERQKNIRYDSRIYRSGFYEATLDEIEKQKFDKEERYRVPKAKLEVMKEYMHAVQEEHRPKVSVEKKQELERLIQKTDKRAASRPQKPMMYYPHTYKTLDHDSGGDDSSVSRGVDWSKYKNPFVK